MQGKVCLQGWLINASRALYLIAHPPPPLNKLNENCLNVVAIEHVALYLSQSIHLCIVMLSQDECKESNEMCLFCKKLVILYKICVLQLIKKCKKEKQHRCYYYVAPIMCI